MVDNTQAGNRWRAENEAACPRRQDQKISFERARAEIQKQLTEQHVPSIAIAVVRDGRILWEEGFGWADKENRVPATENTMFSLASVSKPITATALMILVERRAIDLDRPINDYLGEAKLRVGVDEFAFGEHGNRCCAATHVDAGRAHLGLIIDEC